MEIYKDLSSPASKEFEKLLNSQLSKYVNDMTQFINERENNGDKERETFLNIISAVKDDISYLTTVGRVLKLGDLAYKDPDKFPNGVWCKENDYRGKTQNTVQTT